MPTLVHPMASHSKKPGFGQLHGVGFSLGIVLIFGLTACGRPQDQSAVSSTSATGAAPAGAAVDVCSLVAPDAVTAVIGQPIVVSRPGVDSCKYETEDPMASSVEVLVKRQNAGEEMAVARKASGILADVGEEMGRSKGAKGDVGATLQQGATSAGIGQEAFFDSNQSLHVLDRNAYFTISPPMMRSRMGPGNPMLSEQERRGMAKALAQKVAAAL